MARGAGEVRFVEVAACFTTRGNIARGARGADVPNQERSKLPRTGTVGPVTSQSLAASVGCGRWHSDPVATTAGTAQRLPRYGDRGRERCTMAVNGACRRRSSVLTAAGRHGKVPDELRPSPCVWCSALRPGFVRLRGRPRVTFDGGARGCRGRTRHAARRHTRAREFRRQDARSRVRPLAGRRRWRPCHSGLSTRAERDDRGCARRDPLGYRVRVSPHFAGPIRGLASMHRIRGVGRRTSPSSLDRGGRSWRWVRVDAQVVELERWPQSAVPGCRDGRLIQPSDA